MGAERGRSGRRGRGRARQCLWEPVLPWAPMRRACVDQPSRDLAADAVHCVYSLHSTNQ